MSAARISRGARLLDTGTAAGAGRAGQRLGLGPGPGAGRGGQRRGGQHGPARVDAAGARPGRVAARRLDRGAGGQRLLHLRGVSFGYCALISAAMPLTMALAAVVLLTVV